MAKKSRPRKVVSTVQNEAAARQQTELGNKCAGLGEFDDAGRHYERAIALYPRYAEAHNNLANIYREKNRLADAAVAYERATILKPDFAIAHNNLGIVLRQLNKYKEAEARHRRALLLAPHYSEACFNLANVLCDQLMLDEAIVFYKKALSLNPNYAESYVNLGNALEGQGKYKDAAEAYKSAINAKPNYAEAHHNLGNTLLMLDDPSSASLSFQRALDLRPNYAEAYLSYGNTLNRLGLLPEAIDKYGKALTVRPDHAGVRANRAMVQLRLGNFSEGWLEYEWRWKLKDTFTGETPDLPLWNGDDLTNKKIVLYCEQGLGDSIQFIRYAAMIKDMGAFVVLLCPQPLIRLFKSIEAIDEVLLEGSEVSGDYRAPLMSLPMFFRTSMETIPATIPYLSPPHDLLAAWGDRVSAYKGLRVGLVWAGNPRPHHALVNAVDRRRSLKLEQLHPLAKFSNSVHFFSLQKLNSLDQTPAPSAGMKLIDFMDSVRDFADTAALISHLDLVIGVDTSVIHLAGALGKNVWVLSRFDSCWRWLQEREDSPWYPTLRLFRQHTAGDWSSVIESVCSAFTEFEAKNLATNK